MESIDKIPLRLTTEQLKAWSERLVFQKVLGYILLCIILSGSICCLRIDPMIDTMSIPLRMIVFSWGTLLGLFYLVSGPPLPSTIIIKFFTVVLSGLSFVADGGAIREMYAFSGGTSHTTQVLAPITSSSECHGRYSRPVLHVKPYADKSIWIKTNYMICDRFEPPHIEQHQCVRLDVQTGKYGIRRILYPFSIETC